jgi:hypothetical protein
MPIEDKTQPQKASSGSPPDTRENVRSGSAPKEEVAVSVRSSAHPEGPESGTEQASRESVATGTGPDTPHPQVVISTRESCEAATVPQDDRALEDAKRRSLETMQPRIRGHQILGKLGQGTYGVVWHAREETTGIEVAIKFFAHGTGEQWQTLQAEVKQLAMLYADPGIVQLIDVEPDAVPPYYIMEYAAQGSLAKRLEQGPMPLEESIAIFQRVVEAMAYVHAKGIRHCDLKPGNILLDARGRPKVADFGQAHLSRDASPALGTFFYMAPEQADLSKQIPDTRWDVYGLGALLYAMLTGRPPREDSTLRKRIDDTAELAHKLERYRTEVLTTPKPTKHRRVSGIDPSLIDIVSRCLEADPERRFHDANAILEALKRRELRRRQRPLLVFGLAAPVLLLVVLGGLGWVQASSALTSFRASQEAQVMADCKTAAGLIQSVIENKLLEQVGRIKSTADGDHVPQALRDKQALLREALLTRQDVGKGAQEGAKTIEFLRTKLKYLGRNGFESWALTDDEGTMLAADVTVSRLEGESNEDHQRRRNDERTRQARNFGKDFSWREWFNGVRHYSENDMSETNKPPVRVPCWWRDNQQPEVRVTSPYLNKRGRLSIGISAPVYLEGRGKKLGGVFLGNIDMQDFYAWLEAARITNGHALVVDDKGACLFPPEKNPLHKVELPRLFQDALGQKAPGVLSKHAHSLANEGRACIGGYAPIRDMDKQYGAELFHWLAVVEQDYATVLGPVERIDAEMRRWGLIMLATACLMLFGMWAWLFKKLQRGERVSHA